MNRFLADRANYSSTTPPTVSRDLQEIRTPPPPPRPTGAVAAVRRAFAATWLQMLFFCSKRAPVVARAARPIFIHGAVYFSRTVRDNTLGNARRILGHAATRAECLQYSRGVVGHFYDFVRDVGQSTRMGRGQLLAKIESAEGTEHYAAARESRKGAILLTAHMGSFEAGLASLIGREAHIHVVFKRDEFSRFERIRQEMRSRLGVLEAAIDDGWTVWMRLRDALARDEVVVAQGDRVLPGQKGAPVSFLGGRLLLPTGPLKLAIASGAPIIPIFTIRQPDGRIRVCIEPAIRLDDVPAAEQLAFAVDRVVEVLAKYVRAYPRQWLALHKVFLEDAAPQLSPGNGRN